MTILGKNSLKREMKLPSKIKGHTCLSENNGTLPATGSGDNDISIIPVQAVLVSFGGGVPKLRNP